MIETAYSLPRRTLLGSAIMTIALPQARAQPAPAGAAMWPYLNGLPQDQRLILLRREAAREGGATVYAAIAIERTEILAGFFKARYPDVALDFVRLTTTDLPQRMLTEQRAGRVNADAAIVAADRLDVMAKAIAPYQPTTWDEFDPRFRRGPGGGGWVALDYELLVEAIGWRTDRITASQAPRTLQDIADLKWKGRTGTITSLEHLYGALGARYGEAHATTLIEGLAALDNRLYPTIAGLSEALGSGQIDLAWGVSAMRVVKLKAAGAPVDFTFQNPPSGNPDSVFVAADAPHPYAAALFMEFLTDATTQEALDKREPGMAFGNVKGHYSQPISSFPGISIYGPIPEAEFHRENRQVEKLFVRRS